MSRTAHDLCDIGTSGPQPGILVTFHELGTKVLRLAGGDPYLLIIYNLDKRDIRGSDLRGARQICMVPTTDTKRWLHNMHIRNPHYIQESP
jgi:hypothetical protein